MLGKHVRVGTILTEGGSSPLSWGRALTLDVEETSLMATRTWEQYFLRDGSAMVLLNKQWVRDVVAEFAGWGDWPTTTYLKVMRTVQFLQWCREVAQ